MESCCFITDFFGIVVSRLHLAHSYFESSFIFVLIGQASWRTLHCILWLNFSLSLIFCFGEYGDTFCFFRGGKVLIELVFYFPFQRRNGYRFIFLPHQRRHWNLTGIWIYLEYNNYCGQINKISQTHNILISTRFFGRVRLK